MSETLQVGIDAGQLVRMAATFRALGKEVSPAVARAVNHTGDKAKTAMTRALTAQTGLKRKVIVRALKVTKASGTKGTTSYAKRFMDERSASILAGNVNDLFDKGIAYGAHELDAKLTSGTLDLQVGISNPIAELAAKYAIEQAPKLMSRAAGAVGPKLVDMLQAKAKARLGSHPDVLALKATIAGQAVGAPMHLAGAAA